MSEGDENSMKKTTEQWSQNGTTRGEALSAAPLW